MSLRAQALREFHLPSAPQRIDELPAPNPGAEAWRVHAPAGRFLLLCSHGPLAMAFEATLFDLLAESRYPAPRPRRAKGGSMIAAFKDGEAAAACYAWPTGEEVDPAAATAPQLLEVGRLLARLHQLGETHPASVGDPADAASLLAGLAPGRERDVLAAVLEAGVPSLPTRAAHGGLPPASALVVCERCSAVLFPPRIKKNIFFYFSGRAPGGRRPVERLAPRLNSPARSSARNSLRRAPGLPTLATASASARSTAASAPASASARGDRSRGF